jgi:nicotinic acid mononucleotide adenylyltransferase
MKLGIFGGGFKPFTMGHFSMLALAASENDKALLLYGLSGRDTPGAEFEYTPQMARQIFDINSDAIEREMPNVVVVEAKPTPVSATFSIIKAFKETQYPPHPLPEVLPNSRTLDVARIDPVSLDTLTIYIGSDDVETYTKYLKNPAQSQKYYGRLIEDGRLRFDVGPSDPSRGVKGMEAAVRKWIRLGDDADLTDRISIRGTLLRRKTAAGSPLEDFRKYIPPIYTDEEASAIFDIMKGGALTKEQISENLRLFIRAFSRS